MTKTTTIMGSPLYMSPEQMASTRDVDARTDIWALGAILYELLTGKVPFQADTITQLCAMILQQPPPPLRNLRPDAPEGLQQIITRCLSKERTQRFQNVAEFASSLAPYAPRRARISIERVGRVIDGAGLGSSRPHLEDELPPSQAHGATGAAWGASSTSKRSNGAVIAIAGVVLLGMAGVAVAAVMLLRSPKTDAAPDPAVASAPVTTAAPPAQAEAATPSPPVVAPAPVTTPTPSASTAGAKVPKASGGIRATQSGKPTPETAVKLPQSPPPPAEPPKAGKAPDLYNDRK